MWSSGRVTRPSGEQPRSCLPQTAQQVRSFRGMPFFFCPQPVTQTTHHAATLIQYRSLSGAVLWAGEGGWVFEIRGVPTWDVNKHLEGRVPRVSARVDAGRCRAERWLYRLVDSQTTLLAVSSKILCQQRCSRHWCDDSDWTASPVVGSMEPNQEGGQGERKSLRPATRERLEGQFRLHRPELTRL